MKKFWISRKLSAVIFSEGCIYENQPRSPIKQTSENILKASNGSWGSSLERRYENHQHHFTSKNPKWSFGSRSEPEVEHVLILRTRMNCIHSKILVNIGSILVNGADGFRISFQGMNPRTHSMLLKCSQMFVL